LPRTRVMEQGLDLFNNFWFDLSQWRPHILTIYGLLLSSLVSSALIARVVGGVIYLAGIVGFAIMYFTGYLAIFLARDYLIPNIDEFQRGLLFSFCGQIFGALIVLQIFKVKETMVGRSG
jgi:uncharacterized membrane protein YjjP (DUF1212 family)